MFNTSDILMQMRQNGINPPEPLVPDEKVHRFSNGSGDHKNSGWYRGYRNHNRSGEEFFVFIYGDWHEQVIYTSSSGVKMDKQEKAWVQDQIRKAQRAAHLEKEELQKKAAAEAEKIWNGLNDTFGLSEYLTKKGLPGLFGARLSGFDLYVPMRDLDGQLKNIERIIGDGKIKKGLYGGQRTGLMHIIGEIGDVIYLCEGFSTAVSVHLATAEAAVCSFNAGNLVPVAQELVKKYPTKKIVVCGDNDQYPNKKGEIDNVGSQKAEEAAKICGGKFIIPQFEDLSTEPTDFNDLFLLCGPESVREQIERINPAVPVETFDVSYVVNHPYPDENPKTMTRKGTMTNICELIRRLRIVIRYNLISKEEEILIPGCGYTIDNRANATRAYLVDWCERCGIPSGNLDAYITAIADANQYNPVATWVTSKPWDGKSRLQELYATIEAKGEKEDVNVLCMKEKLIKTWMISAIAAAFSPNGVSAGGVLVLQGAQYVGKTAWFKRLVPSHLNVVADGMFLRPDDKDSVFQAISKWLVELGELDATFRKADVAQLKAFITKDKDILRRPFAKKESTFARRTIFFGSVNEVDFLKDPTGNRRFWTIECLKIDYNHNLDMQQVWAELLELYRKGASWHLSGAEVLALNEHNENFRAMDPIEEMIRTQFDWNANLPKVPMTATQICQHIGIKNPTNPDTRAAGAALRKLTTATAPVKGLTRFLVPMRPGLRP